MKYLDLRIQCKQPIKISSSINTQGSSESLTYILGSSIRGAFISNYIEQSGIIDIDKNEKTKNWFFNNKLEFLNGYLEFNNERTLPMPIGLYADSIELINYQNNDLIKVKSEFKDIIEDTDKKLPGGDFISLSDNDSVATISVEKIYNLHIKKGKDKDMFIYEAIKENQTFRSYIKCDVSDEEVDEIKDIINNSIFYLGGSKGSGYGEVIIEIIDETYDNPEDFCYDEELFEGKFVIYTLSDGVYFNQYKEAQSYIDEKHLENILEVQDVKVEKIATDTSIVGGYNNKWKCRLPQYEGNKAGSIYEYSYKGKLKSKNIEKLMNSGIGLRTEEGYGRILIMPYFNINKVQKAMKNNSGLQEINKLEEKENNQIKYIVNSICRNKINEIMQKRIVEDYKSDKSVNKSQIGKLVQLFDVVQAFEKKDGISKIKDYIDHLKIRHDNKERENQKAYEQLKDLKIRNKTSIEYIEEEIEGLKNNSEFYKQYNINSISINGIKPEINEQEIYVYKMIELENIFRYILRKEGKKNGTKR